jgi:multicomponent K+:H+ antiporter subunit E
MTAWLPSPLMSLALFAGWLLLNGVSAGSVALGALLAVAIPVFSARFRGAPPRIARWPIALRLTIVVLWDIVVSNVQVAALILGPERRIEPRFVWLPLDIRDPHGISALAGIITMTPGTLSADLTDDHRYLLVHALNAGDEAALVRGIKERYETPLRIIFGEAT